MSVLVLAEHDNSTLKDATLAAVTAASKLGGEVHVLVAGSGAQAAADAAAQVEGVAKVLLADDAALAHGLAENLAPLLVDLMAGYDALVAPATSFGKNVAPRVAALLDVAQVSDITAVEGPDTFQRPIYAGNAVATVQSGDAKKVITVRATAFAKASASGGSAAVETVAAKGEAGLSRFVGAELSQSDRPELTSAKIVVSGGRALGSAEAFQTVLEPLADKLGAAVGASRAAVDAGYMPNDYQVGQTGKIVAPELYVAVGISGAIQHLAGMKDSKVIVAINKDEEAPIFQVADFGLVADLFQAVPELAEKDLSMLQDVVIVAGARTAIGDFGGALKDLAPAELGRLVIAEALRRAGVDGQDVGHVIMGQVIQSEPKDMYLARVAAMQAGIPSSVPALTLNRLCGSGLQAIISAAQTIRLGECAVAVAGGAESMSRAPHVVPLARWGQRLGDATMIDALIGVLTDPFGHGHMGITAENVAERHGIDRAAQDALAVESHKRAARAIAEGRFKDQILPVEIKTRKGTVVFDTDEHVRADASLEDMAKLKPAFKRDGGTVTPGNASGINDGAAAVVLMAAEAAKARGAKPLARIVSWGHAGVDPEVMGLGPVKAVPVALARAGLQLADIDVIESNEAFAAQACAVAKELGFDPERTNPNGSGVSLGHPVGATGAILTVKTLYELQRTGGRHGLITMCIGGGQGIAMIIERL